MLANLIGVYKKSAQFRAEIWIFAAAFVLGSIYAVAIYFIRGPHVFLSFSDAEFFYYRLAINLVSHQSFSLATQAPYYPDAYHTPLYPLFVAAFFWLKQPLIAIMIVQNALAGLAGILVYRIGRILTGNAKIALVAALLSVLEPMSLYWRNLLMSDFLFAFLIISAIYLLARRSYLWVAVLMALATLTRPIGMYFFAAVVIFVLIQLVREKLWSKQRIAGMVTGMIALFIMCISPWYIHNHAVWKSWSFASAGPFELYAVVLPPLSDVTHFSYPPFELNPAELHYEFSRFDMEYNHLYTSTFLAAVKAHPLDYLIFHLRRSLYSLFSDRYAYVVTSWISPHLRTIWAGISFWVIMYVLALLSLGKRINQRYAGYRAWAILFAALVAINVILSGLINPDGYSMSRYMIPFIPFIFLSAGVGYDSFFAKTKSR